MKIAYYGDNLNFYLKGHADLGTLTKVEVGILRFTPLLIDCERLYSG